MLYVSAVGEKEPSLIINNLLRPRSWTESRVVQTESRMVCKSKGLDDRIAFSLTGLKNSIKKIKTRQKVLLTLDNAQSIWNCR